MYININDPQSKVVKKANIPLLHKYIMQSL